MKMVRAQITGVDSQRVSCNIESSEMTEQEALARLKGGESSFQKWIERPSKTSYQIENPRLLDVARSSQDRNVVLSLDDGKVVAIDSYSDGPVCHFCNNRRFTGDFAHEALCNRVGCRKLIKELFEVTRPRAKDEMWGAEGAGIGSRYVYQSADGKKEYTPWESPGKRRFIGREFYYEYRAHRAKICTACEGRQEGWKMPAFQKWLQDEFVQNKRVYNVTGAVVSE